MDRTCLGVVDASNVVHATGDEVDAVRRPGKVIDFGAYRPAHGLDSPRFLVFKTLLEVVGVCLVLGRYPQQHIAVVTGGGQDLAFSMSVYVVYSGFDHCTPRGLHLTTFTACVCLTSVER